MLDRDQAWFKRLSNRFRQARFARFADLLAAQLGRQDNLKILDVGGIPGYWAMLPPALHDRVSITILNRASAAEDHVPSRWNLVVGDACSMPDYADGSFDFVHSNSVIEHVGSYRNMIRFAAETRRVGRGYYLQTPNFWFPIDPHYAVPFVHWLPDPVRAQLFSRARVGVADRTDYLGAIVRMNDCRIVSRSLVRALFPDGEHFVERFAGMIKSLIVVRPPTLQ